MEETLAQTPYQETWVYQQERLQVLGWSADVIMESARQWFSEHGLTLVQIETFGQQARLAGSPVFQDLWAREVAAGRSSLDLLQVLLATLDFPDELTLANYTQALENWADLAPDDVFWRTLARAVQETFPVAGLSQQTDLARQIHQLRYLISNQQADWVRRHYGRPGRTDRSALVAYLAGKNARNTLLERLGLASYDYAVYDVGESARLHNKQAFDEKNTPLKLEGLPNIKVLINFHTEFILDSKGNFVNIFETGQPTLNGPINGASFNYANRNDLRHLQLDVVPTKVHDPKYRRRVFKSASHPYRSPRRAFIWQRQSWQRAYGNPRGIYANRGRSMKTQVKQASRKLSLDIKKLKKVNGTTD
ncbi:DUF3114 domain-containing protein [Streptococcus caprae]